MDLQTRKLKAIEKRNVKPFTQQQLLDRAKQSEQDYLSGKIKDQDQLDKESEILSS
jgi:hypothetical protein